MTLRTTISAAAGPDVVRARILRFIDAHPDALHRSCIDGHLTASAAVVDRERSAALLVLHRKLGLWLQPGGHADGDADLAAVALREATEETGIVGLQVVGGPIDLDVHEIPAHGDDLPHLHLDVRYLIVAPSGSEPAPNEEVDGVKWVTPDELDGLDGSTVRLLRQAFRSAGLVRDQ
jgi:8-oxo-dGTP pyrophosphatase MutT (NUDIX family)